MEPGWLDAVVVAWGAVAMGMAGYSAGKGREVVPDPVQRRLVRR